MTTLTPPQVARYGFFRSESEFVRGLTDLCEEMRFVDVPDRKKVLLEKLTTFKVPGCVYLPLTRSTDVWRRVVCCREKEAHPFSTRERCPCLLTFEVATEGPSDIDVANYLYMALGLGATVGATDTEEEDDLDESLDALEAESNASHNGHDIGGFANQREAWRLKFIESARMSVTDLSGMPVGGVEQAGIVPVSEHPAVEDVTHEQEVGTAAAVETKGDKEEEVVSNANADEDAHHRAPAKVDNVAEADGASGVDDQGAVSTRPSSGSVFKRNKRLSNVAAFQSTRKMVEVS
jgi:hypothetical protein